MYCSTFHSPQTRCLVEQQAPVEEPQPPLYAQPCSLSRKLHLKKEAASFQLSVPSDLSLDVSVQAGQPRDQVVPLALSQHGPGTKAFSRQVTIYRQLKWQSREQNPELNPILHATKLKLLLGGISVLVAYLFTAIQGSSQGVLEVTI